MLLPALLLLPLGAGAAPDRKPPEITNAEMLDLDGDGRADRVDVRFGENVNCPAFEKDNSPFTVDGYVIKKVRKTESKPTVIILLEEKARPDPTSSPTIFYAPPKSGAGCRDGAGNPAARQRFDETVPLEPQNETEDIVVTGQYVGNAPGRRLECGLAQLSVGG